MTTRDRAAQTFATASQTQSPGGLTAEDSSDGRGDTRLDGILTVLVVVSLIAFYIAIQRAELVSWDGRDVAGVAQDLWRHGRLQGYGHLFGTPQQPVIAREWSPYGIGMSLLLTPLWAFQGVKENGAQFLTLANPLVLAATGALLFRIIIEVGWRRSTAVGAALVFGMLTMAPMYSTELFSEPAVTLGTVAVVLGLIRWRGERPSGPWLIGMGTAWSILFRFDSTLLVGAVVVAIPLFVPWSRLRRSWRSWIVPTGMPVCLSLIWTGYYNVLRTGSLLVFSYGDHAFDYPLLDGLQRQLWSTGKGFFWYNPILLVALPGLMFLWRRDRNLALLISGLAVLRVVTYAKWPFPDGSVAWGPRFLLPWCALLVIPLASLWEAIYMAERRRRRTARIAIGILGLLSAVVVVASVWVPYEQYWTEIGDLTGVPPSKLNAVVQERSDDAFNRLYDSPLLVNLRQLDRATPFPLYWFRDGRFRGGRSLLGLAAVATSIGAASLALGGAVSRDRRKRARRAPVP
jgi:hypothetical protein